MDARRDPDPQDDPHRRYKSPDEGRTADQFRWGFLLLTVLGTVASFALLWVIWELWLN